jgi:TRAP-type C4-dicarboxylate transport system permease small subunit
VFLLIFVVFTGAPFVQKSEHHLNVDLLIVHLSPRAREFTIIVVSILSWIIAGVVGWYAWPMWWEAVSQHQHSMSLWGPPLWIPYLFLPLGMTALFLQYILYLWKKIDAFRKGEIETEKERFELRDIELKDASPEERGPNESYRER